MEGDTRLARGLAPRAKRQEQEKAETQPRPQGERQTTAIQMEKDAQLPVQRIMMRRRLARRNIDLQFTVQHGVFILMSDPRQKL